MMIKSLWVFFLTVVLSVQTNAQQVAEDGVCKTYYDSSKKQLKEIYHYILNYTFTKTADGKMVKDTTAIIKNGPYLLYDSSERLICSGQFNNNIKTGEWIYYNSNGIVTKKEFYINGVLQ